jgi:hypothetical protein
MQAMKEDDLTEVPPMLSTNTVQIYIYIKVGASYANSDILLTGILIVRESMNLVATWVIWTVDISGSFVTKTFATSQTSMRVTFSAHMWSMILSEGALPII